LRRLRCGEGQRSRRCDDSGDDDPADEQGDERVFHGITPFEVARSAARDAVLAGVASRGAKGRAAEVGSRASLKRWRIAPWISR
jgi:hypothetical protein